MKTFLAIAVLLITCGCDGYPCLAETADPEMISNQANNLFSSYLEKNKEYITIKTPRMQNRLDIINEIAHKYGYNFYGSEADGYNGWIIFYKQSNYKPTIVKNEKDNPSIISELDQFIARKNKEITKLEETKQSSVAISSSATDKTIIVHISAFIAEIDSRIEMIQSITAKAESFRKDVNDFEKVEQIRKWLNEN